jgi:hypothetical protein
MIDIPYAQIVKSFYICGILCMVDGLLCCSGSMDSLDNTNFYIYYPNYN